MFEDSVFRRASARMGFNDEGKSMEGGQCDSKGVACREEMIVRGDLGEGASLKEYNDTRVDFLYGKGCAAFNAGKMKSGEGDINKLLYKDSSICSACNFQALKDNYLKENKIRIDY